MPERKLEVKKLEKWAESFEAVSHPIRLALVVMLYGSDLLPNQKSLTFAQMLDILGLPKAKNAESSLSYHLDRLIESGFIAREPVQEEPGKSHIQTIYHITTKGQEFLADFNLVQVITANLSKKII